jgi:pyruvate/2-oxoglutarate dehydrogenase complex dihydrolipoamide acyltransferase (E2) component
MTRQYHDAQVVPYSRMRQWMAASYRSVRYKPMIHGLIEVDVTTARAWLREYKARTGESLSLTAFLATCLGKAVDEHKETQAIRLWGGRLIIFDDVDIWLPIEHDALGQKVLAPHVIRAANRKSFRAIHDEIRAAQAADVTRRVMGPRVLPPALYGPLLWLFWRIGRMSPRYLKRSIGTVGLTSVGMFGKSAGWGVPPPIPTALLVTVGGIGEKRLLGGDQVTTREYLDLTISVDHDIIDGAPAARFTRRLKELIERGYGLESGAVKSGLAPGAAMRSAPVARG